MLVNELYCKLNQCLNGLSSDLKNGNSEASLSYLFTRKGFKLKRKIGIDQISCFKTFSVSVFQPSQFNFAILTIFVYLYSYLVLYHILFTSVFYNLMKIKVMILYYKVFSRMIYHHIINVYYYHRNLIQRLGSLDQPRREA